MQLLGYWSYTNSLMHERTDQRNPGAASWHLDEMPGYVFNGIMKAKPMLKTRKK